MSTYKIHPGIGVARLGNSDTDFYIAPEVPAGLPIECDAQGNPIRSLWAADSPLRAGSDAQGWTIRFADSNV